jgi:hypothetical protein
MRRVATLDKAQHQSSLRDEIMSGAPAQALKRLPTFNRRYATRNQHSFIAGIRSQGAELDGQTIGPLPLQLSQILSCPRCGDA